MDISSFINSKDIREHHRAIEYEYNALEAAWLVSQCQHATLEEKHEAWRWIIENMPDCEIKDCGGRVTVPTDSVHKVLADYMEMENAFIERFKDASGGHMYMYREYYRSLRYCCTSSDAEGCFTSYEDCVKHIVEDWDAEETSIVEIRRCLPGETGVFRKGGDIMIDLKGKIVSVTTDYTEEENKYWYELCDFFDYLWFNFPVPFKRGDVVYVKSLLHPDVHSPIVIDGIIIPPGRDEEKYLAKRREFGDTTDMNIWGYAADVEWSGGYHGPYYEVWNNYMNVESYREELKGVERALGLISNWLKDKFGDEVDLLMAGYHHIMLEEMLAKSTPVLYTDEALKLAGFEVDEKKDGK